MATVLGILLPYLVLFYVLDSIRVVRKGHLVFFSHGGRRFRWKGAGLRVSGLSPAAQVIQAHCNPLCLTEEGVFLPAGDCASAPPAPGEEPEFLRYEDMGEAAADHTTVSAGGRPLLRAPTRLSAMRTAQMLARLGRLTREERERHLAVRRAAGFNAARLREVRSKHRRLFIPVQACSTALFAGLFCLLPLALSPAGLPALGLLAMGILCLYVLTAAVSYRVCRKVYRAEPERRRTFLVTMVLSPVTAVHALGNLTGDLYHRFDYLTVAAVLLPREDFAELAGRELRRIALLGGDGDTPQGTCWRAREKAIQGLLAETGLSAEELAGEPGRRDGTAVAYCPLCRSQYREGFRTCGDCGVPLKRFGPGTEAGNH